MTRKAWEPGFVAGLVLLFAVHLPSATLVARRQKGLAEQHEQIRTRTGFPLVAKADRSSELINRKPYDGFCEGIERAGFAIKCAVELNRHASFT